MLEMERNVYANNSPIRLRFVCVWYKTHMSIQGNWSVCYVLETEWKVYAKNAKPEVRVSGLTNCKSRLSASTYKALQGR